MSLIPRLGGRLADKVDKVHSRHPLIIGQLNLARKVVQVSKQAAQDLTISRRHVGAHGVDDVFGEVGIEAAGWLGRCAVCVAVGRRHCESFGDVMWMMGRK